MFTRHFSINDVSKDAIFDFIATAEGKILLSVGHTKLLYGFEELQYVLQCMSCIDCFLNAFMVLN